MNVIKSTSLKLLIFNLLIKTLEKLIKLTNSKFLKILSKVVLSFKANLIYVIEDHNWSIKWDGEYITSFLKKLKLLNAEIGTPKLVKNKIIHYGSINLFLNRESLIEPRKSNKKVITWFHVNPDDERLKFLPILNKKVDLFHTSAVITKNELIKNGIDRRKIMVIPLGVDLSTFKCYNTKKRENLKKKLNIPMDKLIIGSFQKDGIGWGEGLKPKLIKGPDIFCEVVKRISNSYNIHIILTGPSRGYVKRKLDEYNITYTHIFLNNYRDIVKYYNILDLYIITSRVEGGPKALLEGMATGIPIVSTKVGMANLVIKHGFNGFLTDVDNIEEIVQFSKIILNNKELRERFIKNGLDIIQKFSWEKIAKDYYYKIYKKLLK